MGALKIGRVGLDIDLKHPQAISWEADEDGRRVTIAGYLRATSLAQTKVLRSELLAQRGQLVPIVYTGDDGLTGVGILDEASIEANWEQASYEGVGYLPFEVICTYVGSYSEVEFQSLLTHVDAAEDFATTPSYWHSPPIGARAYGAGEAQPSLITRSTEDGDIYFAYDVPAGTHPTWSVAPANYYDGAVELTAGGFLRAGRDMPMDPADWEINAKTLKVRPGGFQTASDGTIEIAVWDGTAWDPYVGFAVWYRGTNIIPSWDFVSVLKNTPEAVTVRLVRDALEANPSTAKHELDITVRRGARIVSMVYKFDGAAGPHEVGFDTTTASTAPGGASYIYATSTINGHRMLVGTPRTFTADTTEGRVQLSSNSRSMPWWVGAVVNNTTDAGQATADLAEQYVGQSAEQVRAVRR